MGKGGTEQDADDIFQETVVSFIESVHKDKFRQESGKDLSWSPISKISGLMKSGENKEQETGRNYMKQERIRRMQKSMT
jgi:hypothetical protein